MTYRVVLLTTDVKGTNFIFWIFSSTKKNPDPQKAKTIRKSTLKQIIIIKSPFINKEKGFDSTIRWAVI